MCSDDTEKPHVSPGPPNMLKWRLSNWGILPHCSQSEPRDTASSLPVTSPVEVLAACAVLRITGPSFHGLQGPLWLDSELSLPASFTRPPRRPWTLAHSPPSGPGCKALSPECSFPWEYHSALSRSQVLKYFSFSTQKFFLQVDYFLSILLETESI